MPVYNLDKIFKPRRVAVIGASTKPNAVGHVVLKNLISAGFAGTVYPVNPKVEAVLGIHAYKSLADLPHAPDLAVICTPAATAPDLVRQCGALGVMGVTVISAGFREAGPAGVALEEEMRVAQRAYPGLRVLGPNCLGFIVPGLRLNASFAAATPKSGSVGFISQSGALCTSVLDWALRENIGFSYFVSIGNMFDIGVADLIDYIGNDPETKSIILYVESITDAREFVSAARAFTRNKPIVVYKAGRFAESAQAAASHTGAIAGSDTVYQAAFERAGLVRVLDASDMFDCAELLARHPTPRGPNLGIVTNAGGPGVMATDELMERQGVLAKLSPATLGKLNDALPGYWSRGNPVDVLGDAPPERFAAALDLVLADEHVDAALVIVTPQAMTDPTATARVVAQSASKSRKPVLAAWMGGESMQEGVRVLNHAGVPTYNSPERAVRAFMYLVSHARNRQILYETPRDIPLTFEVDRPAMRRMFAEQLAGDVDILSESHSKEILESYGVATTRPYLARDADEAARLAAKVGFPVACKLDSPDITHKTDVGGVALGLTTPAEVQTAFEAILSSARRMRPEARLSGVTIQRMAPRSSGHELIVGATKDPVFGAVLMVGMGGVAAEVHRDVAFGLPPLNERLARRMLQSLRSWPLLKGYRGRPPANVDKLIEVLMRLSYLVADAPEIKELDINPVLVTPGDVLALDARIVLDRGLAGKPSRPFSHLAIRPYPEEFCRDVPLRNGRRVRLRPIRPEDEPMWHELLANCSQRTIWFRFRHLFKETTHEMAARFCFIDYDREIALVAEHEQDGKRSLVGVGRLVADVDHRDAEYAVLVQDSWQGQGLGTVMTDFSLEICRQWNIRRVTIETTPDNGPMLAIFRKREFQLDFKPTSGVVLGRKDL